MENLHPASWFYAAEVFLFFIFDTIFKRFEWKKFQETPEKEADDSRNIWKENWGGLVFEQSVGKMQVKFLFFVYFIFIFYFIYFLFYFLWFEK